jgi:hypothetical protein
MVSKRPANADSKALANSRSVDACVSSARVDYNWGMTGQMKRYKMELTHGIELVGPVNVGTAAVMTAFSSDYDSSKPLEAVRAAAECFASLIKDFSENAVSATLRKEFQLELTRRL